MIDGRPGLDARRVTQLMRRAIERCALDLSGLTVLTEAASGCYLVTPVLAALAGAARVLAVARTTHSGRADDIGAATLALARQSNVADRIELVTSEVRTVIARADIVTNSGHVRPIDASIVAAMKPHAVVPLMYEAWEFRPDDLDLAACRRAGVLVGGTNERHPNIDVFSYLPLMAVRLLTDAGIAVYRSSILLLCDNPFRTFLERGLRAAGACVESVDHLAQAHGEEFDAILVSVTPGAVSVITSAEVQELAQRWPGAIVAQFWGDVDRTACTAAGVPVWPVEPPRPGHMGLLLSDLGPEPIVRLQTGGLKAGEVLWRHGAGELDLDWHYVDLL